MYLLKIAHDVYNMDANECLSVFSIYVLYICYLLKIAHTGLCYIAVTGSV